MSTLSKSMNAMIDDVVSATVAYTGYPEVHVRQFVEPATRYMLSAYSGERLPKPRRSYPMDQIAQDLAAGVSMREVCRKYKIGFSTLYRLLATSIATNG